MGKVKYYLAFALVCLFAFQVYSKPIKCPDGQIVFRDKKNIKNLKGFTKTFNANIKGTVDAIDKLKIENLDAGVGTQVVKLRNELDQYGNRSADLLMAMLIQSNNAPCDTASRNKTNALFVQIQSQSYEIEKLKHQVTNIEKQADATKEVAIGEVLVDFKGTQEEIDKLNSGTLNTLQIKDEWVVVCSGDKTLGESDFENKKIERLGFNENIIILRNGAYRLVTKSYNSREEAIEAQNKLRQSYRKDVYVVNLKTWCPNKVSKGGFYECN